MTRAEQNVKTASDLQRAGRYAREAADLTTRLMQTEAHAAQLQQALDKELAMGFTMKLGPIEGPMRDVLMVRAEPIRAALAGTPAPPASQPALIAYMTATTTPQRDAAWLRTYAERVRNGTAASWEIPNTVASTMEDIAQRIEAAPPASQEKP